MSALVVLSEEKIKATARSTAHARGFVEGEACRMRGGAVLTYCMVGLDDYAVGFRTGYFDRGTA